MRKRTSSHTRGSSLVAFLAVLFSLGLIALFAGYGTMRQLLTPQWVRENIIPRVEDVLGRELTFEGFSIGLGEVILTGVRLSENAEFKSDNEAYFAVIERLELGLDVFALTELRLVVHRLELIRPYVRLYRLDDARWNISALVSDAKARSNALAAAKKEPAPAVVDEPAVVVWGANAVADKLRTSLLDWTGWLVHDVHIKGGLLLVEDDATDNAQYDRVAVRDIRIEARDFRLDSPIDFSVRAEIVPDPEQVWTMDADATYDLSENRLFVDGRFDHFEPELLVSQLARPLRLPVRPKKPESKNPFRLDADLTVGRLPYWRFDASEVTGSIVFRRRTLELHKVKARHAGGTITASGSIRFEPSYAHHDLAFKLERVPFADSLGKLLPPPWSDISGTQTVDIRGKFDDPRGVAFADSLLGIGIDSADGSYVKATIVVDVPVLDLDAMTAKAPGDGKTPPHDYGPVDAGRLDAELALTIDRLRFRNIDFLNARVKGSLRDSVLEIAALESGIENGGKANLSGNIVLNRPGFAYAARLDIDGADHGVLLRSVAQPNWGSRSGRTDVRIKMSGAGTTWETVVPNLAADLGVVVHDGRIHDAEFLDLLADETGIEGFRNMELVESGGRITVEDSRIRTQKLTLGSEEARILLKGSIGFDESLDLKMKLGFGPNSERRLLSKGLLLPYEHDEEGWTNIPLIVAGDFEDPKITIESSALASTAVNMVPDATKRLGKESANVTRAITDKAADAMPKPAGDLLRGAHSATERVIGGTYGSLEKVVRGIGRVLTGRASADTKVNDKERRPASAIDEVSDSVDDDNTPARPAKDPPEIKTPRNYDRNVLH
jgi:hypothetical protein